MGFLKKLAHKAKSFGSKALTGAGGFLKQVSDVGERALLAADVLGLDINPYGAAAHAAIAGAGALGNVLESAGEQLKGAKSVGHGMSILGSAVDSVAPIVGDFIG